MRSYAVALVLLVLLAVFLARSRGPAARAPRRAPNAPTLRPERAPVPEQDARSGAVPKNPDATLHVVVRDAEGRPCAGAVVQAGILAGGVGRSGPGAVTDAEGRVVLDIEAGRLRSVTARVGCLSRWVPTRVTEGARKEIAIVMPTGGSIVGEIRHPRSGPLGGVVLLTECDHEGCKDFLRAETDAAGRFRFDPVPQGTCKIDIHVSPCGHTLKEYVVVRHDGTETIDVGTILVGGATLEGTVRDAADAFPLSGVKVSLRDPVSAETTTDAAGRYAFRDLTASVYDLVFRKSGYGSRHMRDVELRPDRPQTLDVTLVRGEVLDVVVHDTEDRPVSGPVQLSFLPRGSGVGGGARLNLDEQGHGRYAGLAPGRYRLEVRRNDLECAPLLIEIAPGRNKARFRVRWRPYTWGKGVRSLHGTVRNAGSGRPIPGVRIDGPRGEVYTNADGEYVLHDLGVGEHGVFVSRDGYGDLRARPRLVRDGEEKELNFTLEPAATLVLMLRDKDGRPVVGELRLIYVRRVEGKKMGGGGPLRADDDGRAVFRRLLPGHHKLILLMPGIGNAETEIDIEPGENVSELVLAR